MRDRYATSSRVGWLVLILGCSSAGERIAPWYVSRDKIVEIIEGRGATPAPCPDYLANTVSSPGEEQLCFRSSTDAVTVAHSILEALPARPGTDIYEALNVSIEEGAQTSDGCDVDIISNGESYVYLHEQAPNKAGGCIFWVMERSRCDDGTLVVLIL